MKQKDLGTFQPRAQTCLLLHNKMQDLGERDFTKLVRDEIKFYNQNIFKSSTGIFLKNLAYTEGMVYLGYYEYD